MRCTWQLGVWALALTSMWVVGCSKPSGRPYSSPEKCYSAAQEAYNKADWAAYVDCLSSECRNREVELQIRGLAMLEGHATGQAQQEVAAVKSLLAKQGVANPNIQDGESPDEYASRLLRSVQDRRAFLIAYVAMLREQSGDRRGSWPELRGVTVDGNKATSPIVVKDAPGEVTFEKEGDSWLLSTMILP